MAGQTLNLNHNTATDAAFRLWGGGISASLATAGLVQTSDTGQINWSTVTTVGTFTVAGYEVWRFNDSLQSTKPIYLKLEYGTGAATSNVGMWITCGTATNGSGTLSSQAGTGTSTTNRISITNTSTTSTAATGSVYVNMPDSSCIGVLAWPGISSTFGGFFFMVERTRDPDGTPNSDGYINLISNAHSTTAGACTFQQRHFYTTAQYSNNISRGMAPAFDDTALTSLAQGTTLYPLPFFTGLSPRLGGASKLVVVLGKTDVAANNSFSMTHYGSSRSWISAGAGATSGGGWGPWCLNGGSGISSFAMRMD